MIILETICNQDEINFINKQINAHPEIEFYETDSVGLETLVQIVIPVAAIMAPVISAIVTKIIENKKVTIKRNGYEVTAGSYKEAMKIIREINQGDEDDN